MAFQTKNLDRGFSFHYPIPGGSYGATARGLTYNLGGTWYGNYGTSPCPVCQPERRRDQHGLSASDIKALQLPPDPARLIIAHDNDENGAGQRAAIVLADRAIALGWQVSLMDPGDGKDFNDAWLGRRLQPLQTNH